MAFEKIGAISIFK